MPRTDIYTTRGTTLIWENDPPRLTEYYHIPGNLRMPYVAGYLADIAFDCALRGPFNKLRPAGSQRSRLSVSARIVFISASTV